MNKRIAIALISATLLSSTAAFAQSSHRDSDRDGRSDAQEWNRDRDHDGRQDQYDRNNNRHGVDQRNHNQRQFRYYGGNYGYNGYNGKWRSGQRYNHYRQSSYYLNDYQHYGLPAPRAGYRYYRDDNGDVVMAAIASGVIGLIIGGALNH